MRNLKLIFCKSLYSRFSYLSMWIWLQHRIDKVPQDPEWLDIPNEENKIQETQSVYESLEENKRPSSDEIRTINTEPNNTGLNHWKLATYSQHSRDSTITIAGIIKITFQTKAHTMLLLREPSWHHKETPWAACCIVSISIPLEYSLPALCGLEVSET